MQNKKTLIIVSTLLIVAVIAAAYYFSSGILLKGEVPPGAAPPPPDDIEIAPLATNEDLLNDIANNIDVPEDEEPVDDALLLDTYDGIPVDPDPTPDEPVNDALLLDTYDGIPVDPEPTPEEPIDENLLLDTYDGIPVDPDPAPDGPVDDALLLDTYDGIPVDPDPAPEEPVDDALLLDTYDFAQTDPEPEPDEPVDDALFSVADELDVPTWIDSPVDDTETVTETTVETIIIKETIIATPEAPEDGPPCGFNDIEAGDPDCTAFIWVKNIGAMTGVDGNFLPNDLLQRDQIVKVVGMSFDLFGEDTTFCQDENPFPDVDKEDWACEYIFNAKNAGIATGYGDGTFKSARFVNRAEYLAFVIRNLDHETIGAETYTDISEEAWYKVFASYAYDHGLFEGEELFPNNFTNRREVAKILFKLHNEELIE